jgi:hypothetical protein
MAYTAEHGNFEGRARANGGFGNETGQTDRRGRSGEAQAANRNAINRAATLSGPTGPFKSPVYGPTWQNLPKFAKMVGPMIVNPGIGVLGPLAKSIITDDPYGALGIPSGWSGYSQRDIDPMGDNPRGNIGGHDTAFGTGGLAQAQRRAALAAAIRRHQTRPPSPANATPVQSQPYVPVAIGEQVPGLPLYGTATQGYGKAGGYGGVPRAASIGFTRDYV